ncbi:SNF-related serine/threonine-protein kinase-like isoform X4 [Patella vulgata]|uniref:SNF-related serine/threonine-protein kinase-like isoform X4 n=1 Tax=Patella vulgata TaxID=6465 RepID=UPI0024A7E4A7|nr:SNF-related serine/threonine-protein kinase-like isoform X4 [Patella vulgata]
MSQTSKMSTRKQRGDYDGKIAGLYDLEDTIGRGHFAVVKLARHVFTGEKVAVKVIDKTKLDEVSRAHLFQEVRCMKLVQHPHVVRLYEVIDTQTKLYLILELGDGGDMYDYIMKHKAGLQESAARIYFRQIVEAISYCHKLHVVHRDLKPENVVFFEKLGIVKLTDFGFSNMFNPGKQLETSCGSLAYSAPEILLGDAYDAPAVDVWSLGVILFMLVCGTPPFQEANDSETLTMIMDCKYKVPSSISTACQQLISRMLIREPSKRANLGEILNNPWLAYGLEYGVDYMPSNVPLISREHISDEDHDYVIQKMVEGKIGSKDEILESLEKDGYDHIAATYYLLVERRLKKHEQVQNQHAAAMTHLRKKSDAGHHGKPHLEPLSLSPRVKLRVISSKIVTPNSPGMEGIETRFQGVMTHSHKEQKDIGYVQSLVSPPGTHPTSSTSPSANRHPNTPEKKLRFRKCSLIKEESVEHVSSSSSSRNYMEVDVEPRPVKSMENLLDIGEEEKHAMSLLKVTSPNHDQHKRSLKSVCSSPQLLNQIFEENESDDEDDLVPSKFQSNAMFVKHSGVASPEILRKYEQRTKRRGTGQRGTSCSSSDASDTDETEGRSRKDKLKHKFAHRRDSSDHSSDTDGPSGHGGNFGSGAQFNGGSSSGGSGGSGPSNSQDKNSKDYGGKDNSGSKNSKGHRQNHIGNSLDRNMKVLTNRLSQLSANSFSSSDSYNCSPQNNIVNQRSFSSLSAQYIGHTDTDSLMEIQEREFSEIGQEYEVAEKRARASLCSDDCILMQQNGQKSNCKITTDINSNGVPPSFCKPDISHCLVVPNVESKCCSVV